MNIVEGGLDDVRVVNLLVEHVSLARAATAVGSAHALDLSGLRAPDIKFWSVWDGQQLMGVGALKTLSPGAGEVKSMHVAEEGRRRGIGLMIVRHIINAARQYGLKTLYLETGVTEYFAPARQLYRKAGFVECAPFADYRPDPNSAFYRLELDASE